MAYGAGGRARCRVAPGAALVVPVGYLGAAARFALRPEPAGPSANADALPMMRPRGHPGYRYPLPPPFSHHGLSSTMVSLQLLWAKRCGRGEACRAVGEALWARSEASWSSPTRLLDTPMADTPMADTPMAAQLSFRGRLPPIACRLACDRLPPLAVLPHTTLTQSGC
jgi:hypothetical protein